MDGASLRSIVFRLLPQAQVAPLHGRHLHAAFLGWIGQEEPALATALHESNVARPFTLALLAGDVVRAGYLARCTALDERLGDILLQRLSTGPSVRLGSAEYGVALDRQSSWWAETSWEDLLQRTRADRQLEIEFASPAFFSEGRPGERRRAVLFPLPRLVWESWARKWQRYGPDLPELHAAGTAAERAALVSDFRLTSTTLDYGRFQQKGVAGWVRYVIEPGTSRATTVLLNQLAAFAFYAGTGAKTAMGFGATRRCSGEDIAGRAVGAGSTGASPDAF